jgi:hypothetical protein
MLDYIRYDVYIKKVTNFIEICCILTYVGNTTKNKKVFTNLIMFYFFFSSSFFFFFHSIVGREKGH